MEFPVGIYKLPVVFTAIMALVLALTVFNIFKYLKSPKEARSNLTGLVVRTAAILLVGAVVLILPGFNNIRIDENRLETFLLTGFTRVSISSEDIIEARVVDWVNEPGLKPVRRNLGTGLGSYKEGRFTLDNGERVLLYTSGTRVLLINTSEVLYMFGPDDFEEFLQYFNENIHEVEGMD